MESVPQPAQTRKALSGMELVPFTLAYAAVATSWARSAEEAVMWCEEREFRVPAQVVAGWQRDDEVRAHLLTVGDALIGYGELWLDAQEKEVELARIIIAPGVRGKGYGRILVQLLLPEAVKAGYPDIFMRVHPDNGIALRCYQRAGFVAVDASLAQAWNTGQPVSYVWLRHDGARPWPLAPRPNEDDLCNHARGRLGWQILYFADVRSFMFRAYYGHVPLMAHADHSARGGVHPAGRDRPCIREARQRQVLARS